MVEKEKVKSCPRCSHELGVCIYPWCEFCVAHRYTRLKKDGSCEDCENGIISAKGEQSEVS